MQLIRITGRKAASFDSKVPIEHGTGSGQLKWNPEHFQQDA